MPLCQSKTRALKVCWPWKSLPPTRVNADQPPSVSALFVSYLWPALREMYRDMHCIPKRQSSVGALPAELNWANLSAIIGLCVKIGFAVWNDRALKLEEGSRLVECTLFSLSLHPLCFSPLASLFGDSCTVTITQKFWKVNSEGCYRTVVGLPC